MTDRVPRLQLIRVASVLAAGLALAVLAPGSRAVAATTAGSVSYCFSGGGCITGTVAVYADGISLNLTPFGSDFDAISVIDPATGASVANCWAPYFQAFGWNKNCLGVGGGGGWFSFTGAVVNGLRPGAAYRILVGLSTNSPHPGAAYYLSPDLTTEPAAATLSLDWPPAGDTDQLTLTLDSNLVEAYPWTLSQWQLSPAGVPVLTDEYTLSVGAGASATLTTSNQQAGSGGYVYSYQATAGGYSSNRVTFANAPTASVTTSATSASLSWPAVGNGVEIQLEGTPSPNGCDGSGGLLSGWLATGVNAYTVNGLTPNTAYNFCVAAEVPDQPITSGGSPPAWWVMATPAPAWTQAQTPADAGIGSVGQAAFTVSWSANGNPAWTTYEVLVTSQAGGVVADRTVTATSLPVSGLSCGETYNASVRAENGAGSWTNWVQAASVATVPCAPSSVVGANGGMGWSNSAGRGWVTLDWTPVQGATGYRVWVFDGNQYDPVDVGTATSWDSRQWLGYPAESTIAAWGNNSVCGDPFLSGAQGYDLRDDPNALYRKTCGTAYDAYHQYWFRVSAYNASGDSGFDPNAGYFPTLPEQTDTTPPEVTGVTLNDGKAYAFTQSVPLEVTASDDRSGICAVALSPDDVSWAVVPVNGCHVGQAAAAPTTYTYASTVALTAGPGTKTEYVKVEDAAGNWSAIAASTVYMQAAPGPSVVLEVDGGAAVTGSAAVTLDVQAADAQYPQSALQMRFSNDATTWSPWQPFAASAAWTLAGLPGTNAVYVQVENPAGATGEASATIAYEAGTGQAGGSPNRGAPVSFDGVQAWDTPSPLVSASFQLPPGADTMELSLDGVTWSAPEPAVASVPVTLPAGDGLKAVYARYVDGADRVIPAGPDFFVLDTTAPAIESAGWLGRAAVTDNGTATLVLDAEDNVTSPSALLVSVSGAANWSGPLPANGQIPLTLVGDGYVTITVTVTDQAGNSATTELGIFN
jgi:hypothetical protein